MNIHRETAVELTRYISDWRLIHMTFHFSVDFYLTSFNLCILRPRLGADNADVSLPEVWPDAEEDAEDTQASEHTRRAQLKPDLRKFPPGFGR